MKLRVLTERDRPSETPVWCHGELITAYYDRRTDRWLCSRCHVPVRVVW